MPRRRTAAAPIATPSIENSSRQPGLLVASDVSSLLVLDWSPAAMKWAGIGLAGFSAFV
jgi:hypothetical protein